MQWCVHAKRGFLPRNPRKCQLRIQDWQSSIQTEEMVPSDELAYCFYRFLTLTEVGQSSQHLNSCVVKIYLQIGDVYSSNSPTEFQLYGFQINLERDWALWATWLDVRVEFSKSWNEQSKRKVHDSDLEKICLRRWSGVSLSKVLYKQLESWFVWEKLLYRCHELVECMNVNSLVMQWSFLIHLQTLVTCAVTSGPDRKKMDRLAANQSACFARIPDRKKIKSVNQLYMCSMLLLLSQFFIHAFVHNSLELHSTNGPEGSIATVPTLLAPMKQACKHFNAEPLPYQCTLVHCWLPELCVNMYSFGWEGGWECHNVHREPSQEAAAASSPILPGTKILSKPSPVEEHAGAPSIASPPQRSAKRTTAPSLAVNPASSML